jgi:hypothetical protein
MKSIIVLSLLSLISLRSFAVADLCKINQALDKKVFKNLSHYINTHPVKNNIFSSEQVKAGQKLVTKENEFTKVIFTKPYKVEFQIYPESEVEILNLGTVDCGPQLKLISGRIQSTGNHPEVKEPVVIVSKNKTAVLPNNPVAEKCPFEIETEEAFVQPTGTTYLVESGALVDAIAELNGETPSGNNLVGVGETGTIEESSYEKYSVKKGTIKIKLKRISKNKLRNPIKYAKSEASQKNKSKKKVSKNTKDKSRFLAYNEKVKLKAGASMSVKRKKSMKKTQTAELEVIDPSGI